MALAERVSQKEGSQNKQGMTMLPPTHQNTD